MCIGFCFPFDLEVKELIIGGSSLILILVAIWKEIDEGNWKTFSEEAIKRGRKKNGIGCCVHIFQKLLHYIFRGFFIRQILNPYFLFPFLILLTWVLKINNVETGNLVLLLTLIVILWYSKETQVLREEQRKSNKIAQKSNEIQERPILNFYLRGYEMRLRNVGNGPAYNITVSEINAKSFIYRANFDQPNFILEPHKDEKTLVFDVETPSGGAEIFGSEPQYFELFIDRLFPRDADPNQYNILKSTKAVFLINYQGLNNRFYYSIFRIYPKSWILLGSYKLVVEYVESGDGECDVDKAKEICNKKAITNHL